MSSSRLAEQVARETALSMLESPHRDKTFGNPEAWEYMETYLCGERDYQVLEYDFSDASCRAVIRAPAGWVDIKYGGRFK